MIRTRPWLVVVLIPVLFACTGMYIAAPDEARDQNDLDWTIESEPDRADGSSDSMSPGNDDESTSVEDAEAE